MTFGYAHDPMAAPFSITQVPITELLDINNFNEQESWCFYSSPHYEAWLFYFSHQDQKTGSLYTSGKSIFSNITYFLHLHIAFILKINSQNQLLSVYEVFTRAYTCPGFDMPCFAFSCPYLQFCNAKQTLDYLHINTVALCASRQQ